MKVGIYVLENRWVRKCNKCGRQLFVTEEESQYTWLICLEKTGKDCK